jgi:hypothetical protein
MAYCIFKMGSIMGSVHHDSPTGENRAFGLMG